MLKSFMVAVPFALLAMSAQAQAPNPAQRAACEQDYYRFCQNVGTDEAAVRQCLARNMNRLNPTCRSAFRSGRKRR
jgi:hypothetical protein